MVFDIVVGVVAFVLAYRSAQLGGLAAVFQLAVTAGAAFLARVIAPPVATYMLKAIEWSPGFAVGVSFIIFFVVLQMSGHFIAGRAIEAASDNHGDGGSIDQFTGFVIGGLRAAVLVFCVLAPTILMTQRFAGSKPWAAFQYQKSRVGKWVLTHNLIDPEPFPNASALLRLVDASDGSTSARPHALGLVADSPKVTALMNDVAAVDAIRYEDWKQLRNNPNVLAVVTDAEFLRAANEYTTVRHSVDSEEPSDRFDELDDQRRELER